MFVIVALMYYTWPGAATLAFALFIGAAVGDWYDGYLARKRGLVSNFGKLMDAMADKIMVMGIVMALVFKHEDVYKRQDQTSSQQPSDSTKLNSIRVGMTKPEVLSILGAPDSTSAQANAEYLTYYLVNTGSDYERDKPYICLLYTSRCV